MKTDEMDLTHQMYSTFEHIVEENRAVSEASQNLWTPDGSFVIMIFCDGFQYLIKQKIY